MATIRNKCIRSIFYSLLNTFLLLSSGAFITYGHHALIAGDRKGAILGTLITIILALIFYRFTIYRIL